MRTVLRTAGADAGRRAAPPPSGFAVRRDWLDGSHDFVDYVADMPAAVRHAATDRGRWSTLPPTSRPRTWSAVPVSASEYAWHERRQRRERCINPNCARVASAVTR